MSSNLLDGYTAKMTAFKNAALQYDEQGWIEFYKDTEDRDIINIRSITLQGYDLKLNGPVCNIVVDPANSDKIKKLHIDFTTGINYLITNKTSDPSDDYTDCGDTSGAHALLDIATYMNNTLGLHVPTT